MAEPKITILTVDDNEALRYSLVRCLREGGYQVLEANRGQQALEIASSHSPDLITLDVRLPDIDGFEVCRLIKDNPSTAHIPVLHVSATFVDAEHRVRGLQGGADAYLSEPINKAELLATVEALLRLKRAETEARRKAADAEEAREELRKINTTLELRVKQRTAELEKTTKDIQELTGRLLSLQDDERRRIARELHDSTGQMLVALSVNLTLLEGEIKGKNAKAGRLAGECVSIIEEMTQQIRTMSYLLHPPLLDETGLRSALQWYVEGFSKRSKIDVKLRMPQDFGRLSQEMEIAIFRIVQECLTNVHRHSGSRTAEVKIEINQSSMNLQVKDYGTKKAKPIPISASTLSPGVGMLGMQERVRLFGGTLHVARTETGTTVEANLPLRSVSAADEETSSGMSGQRGAISS